jgi:hypothetical protein
MSKLAHSNQETMDEIEHNARDAEERGEPTEPRQQQEDSMQITVNGTRHDIPRGPVDYLQIASLAGRPDDQYLTVTYHWSGLSDVTRQGTLMPGKSVEGDDGMIFNAVRTGNA